MLKEETIDLNIALLPVPEEFLLINNLGLIVGLINCLLNASPLNPEYLLSLLTSLTNSSGVNFFLLSTSFL